MVSRVGLYLDDAYARSFEARVLDVKGDRVALDRTAFCPGELGQMPDRGWLKWGAADKANVADVHTDDGLFWHRVAGELPPVGTDITGELDWTHRHRMMRTHTAFHLLSALTFYLCGAQTVRPRVLSNGLRVIFKTDCMSDHLLNDLEQRANQAIAADVPVYTYLLSRDEARESPLLHPLKLSLLPPHIETVRVMEIEGIALDIDTGTHVRSLREIGGVQIARPRSHQDGFHHVEFRLTAKPTTKATHPAPFIKDKGEQPFAM
jgi:misacylated tRNA(Ala) deacylase